MSILLSFGFIISSCAFTIAIFVIKLITVFSFHLMKYLYIFCAKYLWIYLVTVFFFFFYNNPFIAYFEAFSLACLDIYISIGKYSLPDYLVLIWRLFDMISDPRYKKKIFTNKQYKKLCILFLKFNLRQFFLYISRLGVLFLWSELSRPQLSSNQNKVFAELIWPHHSILSVLPGNGLTLSCWESRSEVR